MTVALLHGFAGHPDDWVPLVPWLPGALRPWLPGHGEAEKAQDLDQAAEQVAQSLGPPPWALVGYSLGGRVALHLWKLFPNEVSKLILLGGHLGLSKLERKARLDLDRRRAEALRRNADAFFRKWDALPLLQVTDPDRTEVKAAGTRRAQHNPHHLASTLEKLSTATMEDFRPALTARVHPVALVAGEKDQAYRAMYGDPTLRDELYIAQGCGHRILLEPPTLDAPGHLGQWLKSFLG